MQEVEVKENKCIKCNTFKNVEEFTKDRTRKSGRHPYCKDCQKSI